MLNKAVEKQVYGIFVNLIDESKPVLKGKLKQATSKQAITDNEFNEIMDELFESYYESIERILKGGAKDAHERFHILMSMSLEIAVDPEHFTNLPYRNLPVFPLYMATCYAFTGKRADECKSRAIDHYFHTMIDSVLSELNSVEPTKEPEIEKFDIGRFEKMYNKVATFLLNEPFDGVSDISYGFQEVCVFAAIEPVARMFWKYEPSKAVNWYYNSLVSRCGQNSADVLFMSYYQIQEATIQNLEEIDSKDFCLEIGILLLAFEAVKTFGGTKLLSSNEYAHLLKTGDIHYVISLFNGTPLVLKNELFEQNVMALYDFLIKCANGFLSAPNDRENVEVTDPLEDEEDSAKTESDRAFAQMRRDLDEGEPKSKKDIAETQGDNVEATVILEAIGEPHGLNEHADPDKPVVVVNNETIKNGIGMEWFRFYAKVAMLLNCIYMTYSIIVGLSDEAVRSLLFTGGDMSFAIWCVFLIEIYVAIVSGYLWFTLKKFTGTAYRVNMIFMITYPALFTFMMVSNNLDDAVLALVISVIISAVISALNIIYFQKRASLFNGIEETFNTKNTTKMISILAGVVIIACVAINFTLIQPISSEYESAASEYETSDDVIQANFDDLAYLCGFDSTDEFITYLEESSDVALSYCTIEEQYGYFATILELTDYADAIDTEDPYNGTIIEDFSDYQDYIYSGFEDFFSEQ